ncbi:hypothetical protein J6590_023588 [Homalodisca vitripennis]|nr:hypothetical protein J6590_023588 [Homalodisca vitripennis]
MSTERKITAGRNFPHDPTERCPHLDARGGGRCGAPPPVHGIHGVKTGRKVNGRRTMNGPALCKARAGWHAVNGIQTCTIGGSHTSYLPRYHHTDTES